MSTIIQTWYNFALQQFAQERNNQRALRRMQEMRC